MAALFLSTLLFVPVLAKKRRHPMTPIKPNTPSFAEHYYDYLRSPAVVVIGFILIGPILYGLFKKLRERSQPRVKRKLDCFRLGISKRSNLDDHDGRTIARQSDDGNPRIQALVTYPVKSCRGVELAASEVGPTGLKYDRLFTFAQLVTQNAKGEILTEGKAGNLSDQRNHEWRFITQREFPRLALLETELWVPEPRRRAEELNGGLKKRTASKSSSDHNRTASQSEPHDRPSSLSANGGCVVLRFPLEPFFNPFGLRTETVTIRIPLAPTSKRVQAKQYTIEQLSIWVDRTSAINVSNEIAPADLAKLKSFLGISNPLGLFRVDDRNKRSVTRSLPKDRPGESYTVGFGDAFPLHLLSLASVQAVNDGLPGTAMMKTKLDPLRFRANIYLSGAPSYDEDSWKRISAGHCVKPHPSGKKLQELEGEYHVACRTARCTLPNVDQETGIRDANEPYTTMSKTRKIDKGAYPYPCLGMQMIPLFQQGLLRVGDEVRVTETGEHHYEKML